MKNHRGYRKFLLPRLAPGVVVTAVLAVILFSALGAACSSLTPEEVARRWVNDNVDLASDTLTDWIVGAAPVEQPDVADWLAKEIGQFLKDKIREVIHWDYSAPREFGDGWEVTATASVSFPDYAGFEASLPLILRIEGQEVVDWRPDYMEAYARADIPDIGDVLKGASSILGALNAEDCLEAARDAGVPNSVIEHLNKPASDRNFVEKAAIETAIGAVNIPDGCAESLVGQ